MTMVLRSLILLAMLIGPPPESPATGQSKLDHSAKPRFSPLAATPALPPRVVKRFDFNERVLGNNDPAPVNWNRIDAPGFPRYLEAVFDDSVGHDAAPSYRFALQGGSLATRYFARDIPVMPGAIYQIVAYVRPARVVHAEAVMTASYCDQEFRLIDSSTRQCEPVRGASSEEPWQRMAFVLPPAPRNAGLITLTCELRQPKRQAASRTSPRPIQFEDATAEAWFDDISIIRLPNATLEMNAANVPSACNVFAGDEIIRAAAVVRDNDSRGIVNRLEVFDGDGRACFSHDIATISPNGDHDPEGVPLTDLPAGPYVARLTCRSGDETLVTVERRFIKLGRAVQQSPDSPTPIGVSLTPEAVAALNDTARLLHCMGPGAVKVPIWRTEIDDHRLVYGDSAFNRFLDGLIARGATPVAMLESPPRSLMVTYDPGADGLLDVLASPPARWRPYLALPLARLGARVRHWQLGPDTEPDPNESLEQSRLAVSQVAAELRPLVNQPVVVIPARAGVAADPASATSQPVGIEGGETIALSDGVSWQHISDQIGAVDRRITRPQWALVEQLNPHRLERHARLAEFSRRIVATLAAGMDAVFVRQPWTIVEGAVVPLDELAIAHTFAAALTGCDTATPVWIGPDITGWWFSGRERQRGVLIAWTRGDAGEPRRVAMDLGNRVERLDIWGNRTPEPPGGILLGASPSIFENVAGWRVLAQSSLALDNSLVTPMLDTQSRTLTLRNPLPTRLRARLRIATPVGLHISPRVADVDLAAGQTLSLPLDLQVPTNFPAGDHVLPIELKIDGDENAMLTLRTPLTVEAPGLDVQVLAEAEGPRVRIVQRITNRTDRSLVLRSILVAPGRPRTSRTIPDLPPGQSVTRTYFVDAPAAAGETASALARVGVEEFGGGLIHNVVVPLN